MAHTFMISTMSNVSLQIHKLVIVVGLFVLLINAIFVIWASMIHNNDDDKTQNAPMHRSPRSPQDCSYPVLTLFTTFVSSWQRNVIQENTIKMWSEMGPSVKLVLFKQQSKHKGFVDVLARSAKNSNWDILPVPRANPQGTPMLKDMFITAKQKYKSTFYGYANGDILFTEHLPRTLRAISCELNRLNSTFIIGRRRNYDNPKGTPEKVTSHKTILSTMLKSSTLFRADALDYFITDVHGFNWSSFPDLVIGRPGYDNYLVAKAIETTSVIDASGTILALHQSPAGTLASKPRVHSDDLWNKDLIRKIEPSFKYTDGTVINAQYETTRDLAGKICIKAKPRPTPIVTPDPNSNQDNSKGRNKS